MSELIISKPIKEYESYFVDSTNIYGIDKKVESYNDVIDNKIIISGKIGKTEIKQIQSDCFFVKDKTIYLSIPYLDIKEKKMKTFFYKQKNNKIEKIKKEDFPEPYVKRLKLKSKKYTATVEKFQDIEISVLERDYKETFIFVNGLQEIKGGALIGVIEGRGVSRNPGLLFWPDDKRYMISWFSTGILFKL